MFDINKLIGIPFKLNRKDFDGCDCRGIVYLYYKYVKEQDFPFSDGKKVLFRDKNKDKERMFEALNKWGRQIDFKDLQIGDVVMINIQSNIGALGVCINNTQLLHMDKIVGSCLTKIYRLKDLFLYGFRKKN